MTTEIKMIYAEAEEQLGVMETEAMEVFVKQPSGCISHSQVFPKP